MVERWVNGLIYALAAGVPAAMLLGQVLDPGGIAHTVGLVLASQLGVIGGRLLELRRDEATLP